MKASTPDSPVYRKPRVRMFVCFSLCLAMVGLTLAAIANLGLYINGDFFPDEVRGPHPFAGTVGVVSLCIGIFVVLSALMLSFLSLPLAFFRPPVVANFLVALGGVLVSSLACGILTDGLTRAKSNPVRFHAREVTRLSAIIQQYARKHDGHLPPPVNWCDALAQFDSKAARHLSYPAVEQGSSGLSALALNANIVNKRLADVPSDVVLLFGTKPSQNPVGGYPLLTADEHEGKGDVVLFADLHVEFVQTADFNKLRWEP